MKVVYKYKIEHGSEVEMPQDSLLLHVGRQGSDLMVWALVNTECENTSRGFAVYGTGQPINPDLRLSHVRTLQEGAFVWHIFEVLK